MRAGPRGKTGRTRRYSQRLRLSRHVLTHVSRQSQPWLIFNVRHMRFFTYLLIPAALCMRAEVNPPNLGVDPNWRENQRERESGHAAAISRLPAMSQERLTEIITKTRGIAFPVSLEVFEKAYGAGDQLLWVRTLSRPSGCAIRETYMYLFARPAESNETYLVIAELLSVPAEGVLKRVESGKVCFLSQYGWTFVASSDSLLIQPSAELSLPNKSLEPTPTAVTPPAAQEIAPAVGVAHH